jgi:hypothetical protein
MKKCGGRNIGTCFTVRGIISCSFGRKSSYFIVDTLICCIGSMGSCCIV